MTSCSATAPVRSHPFEGGKRIKGFRAAADPIRMRKLLSARLRDERGIALVMAIGISTVLLITGATALTYTTSSQPESFQTRTRVSAFSLPEAGMNNPMSVLNLPTHTPPAPALLP